MTTKVAYGMTVRVNLSHDETMDVLARALKEEGFAVLTEIDVQKSMWESLETRFPDYLILGISNPALTYMLLRDDPDAGLLLPCKVIVRTDPEDERTVVSALDPGLLGDLSRSPGIERVAPLVRDKLQRVLAKVKGADR